MVSAREDGLLHLRENVRLAVCSDEAYTRTLGGEFVFKRVGIRLVVVGVLTTIAAVVGAQPVEELVVSVSSSALPAESGQYNAKHTISGRFEGVDLGDGVAAAKLEFTVEVANDEGSGFLHDAKGHCIGVALYESDNATSSGICSFKDPDGDVLFMRFAEDPITSSGSAESTGGTGKYEHIRVRQTHRTLDSDQDGERFEATGHRSGVWQTASK